MDDFSLMNSGTLKVQVSGFPSCCINKFLTPLLLSPHLIYSSFKYGNDEVLGI